MIASRQLRSDSEPTCKRVVVTPGQALKWLETVNTNNRRLSESLVRRFARDMADGKWVFTHAGIAFAPDGTLLDGQHRLWAVAEANVPVEFYVWQNVPPEAMMGIDCGKSRSMDDILNIAGTNGEVSRSRLAVLRAMLGGFGSPPTLSPVETSKALHLHHDAIEFALTHLPTLSNARGINTATTRGVIARAYYTLDLRMLKNFCRQLTTGIVTSDEESVVVLLRQYLQENRGNSFSVRMQRYAKIQRALIAWCRGENPGRLYAVSAEYFPLPAELEGHHVN